MNIKELVFKPEPDSTTHGILCVRYTSNDCDHPIRVKTYWPASTRCSLTNAIDYFPELEQGPIPLESGFRSGDYRYRRGIIDREVRIIGGGTTQAIYNEENVFHSPKSERESKPATAPAVGKSTSKPKDW